MESPPRRVLAPRDANANMAVSAIATSSSAPLPLSPPATIEPKKRPLEAASDGPAAGVAVEETPSKKMCLPPSANPSAPRPSLSPATSSVFDMSAAINTSQGTAITEPDAAPRHASASRELSRQRAEILKLRLGLARYKVRTGQVDVPLEQLRVVPAATQRYLLQGRQQSSRQLLPPHTPLRRWQQPQQQQRSADAADGDDIDEETEGRPDDDLPQQPRCQLDTVDVVEDSDASPPKSNRDGDDVEDEENEDEDDDLPRLPQIRQADASSNAKPMPRLLTTPRGNRQLIEPTNITSSAMRGSAVSGLLSLSRS